MGENVQVTAAAHALASFEVDAAIPLLIDYLEDDFVRERMASALLAFGPNILDPLIGTLHHSRRLQGEETPASTGRRVAAASVLGELGDIRAADAQRPLLQEDPLAVRIEAAVALVQLAEGDVFAQAVSDLVTCLAVAPPRCAPASKRGFAAADHWRPYPCSRRSKARSWLRKRV